MYQKAKLEENINEGYWIYNKNKVNLQSVYTNPEEKLWYVVSKYPKDAYQNKGIKLVKNSIIKCFFHMYQSNQNIFFDSTISLDECQGSFNIIGKLLYRLGISKFKAF